MVTVRERINADVTEGGNAVSIRRLFMRFSLLARKNYQYNATAIPGSGANTLLGRPENEIVTVDCAALAGALVILINEHFPDGAKMVSVSHGDGFATQAGSRCFDAAIVGNVRKPAESWAATSRCVFNSHFFVETGTETRWYLDPCMFTTYAAMDEVKSWKFIGSGGGFSSIVKRVMEDPSLILVRTPGPPVPPAPGFNSGFIVFTTDDFTPEECNAMKGRLANPGWSAEHYKARSEAALATINKRLKDRAGIKAPWKFPT